MSKSSSNEPVVPALAAGSSRLKQAAPVIIVGSVMFSFISFWRVAAVVLCDMASTAFYIGGIVEQVIGPVAPLLIVGVMLFSFAMGAVYIESCSMFVRGGVYRVVKEALGPWPAKGAVSALLFDYILTGPISSVSAGQYLTGWLLEFVALTNPSLAIHDESTKSAIRRIGSIAIAVGITIYFFRKNLVGLHESSGKAVKIVLFTTAVAIVVLVWSAVTLAVRGPANSIPFRADLSKKVEYNVVRAPDRVTGEVREMWERDANGRLVPKLDENGKPVPKMDSVTGRQVDPLGFLPHVAPGMAEGLRESAHGPSIWTLLGLVGLVMAFGHSVLAMSGEETMAQVYREVESPKLPNFKKAALVIFTYALILTSSVSIFAVLLIPDEVRMRSYADNLLGGLAMHVVGPSWARLTLNAAVVAAGFLILSGAVNTSIIGSNGVLNRVAEDGVLPDRLLRPHPVYGTTYRLLYLVIGLQLFTIFASGGDMILLGEAYAFGVLWSFFFNAFSMLVLRFKRPGERGFKVPLNIPLGGQREIPIGLSIVFLILAGSALSNLFTKELATITGLTFTAAFMIVFVVTERVTGKERKGQKHEHIEQFTQESSAQLSSQALGLERPYRKLIAIRSPQNLYMLQKSLEEIDPETTDVIVMTAKTTSADDAPTAETELDRYDRKLMTAVIELSERIGKEIHPIVVPTNNPLFAVINTARSLNVQELVVGASNKYTPEEQLDQMSFYWISQHGGEAVPLTIRVLSRNWDVHYDIGGGARIPRISERKARSVAELRAAGVGVSSVLVAHDGTPHSSDLFDTVLTMLDPEVGLSIVHVTAHDEGDREAVASGGSLQADVERARKIGRDVEVHEITGEAADAISRLARHLEIDLIVLGAPATWASAESPQLPDWHVRLLDGAPCPVSVVHQPAIPSQVEADPAAVSAHIAQEVHEHRPDEPSTG
jgi:amino acid transporter/nucleotide-binding universal stress UspA family protein